MLPQLAIGQFSVKPSEPILDLKQKKRGRPPNLSKTTGLPAEPENN